MSSHLYEGPQNWPVWRVSHTKYSSRMLWSRWHPNCMFPLCIHFLQTFQLQICCIVDCLKALPLVILIANAKYIFTGRFACNCTQILWDSKLSTLITTPCINFTIFCSTCTDPTWICLSACALPQEVCPYFIIRTSVLDQYWQNLYMWRIRATL